MTPDCDYLVSETAWAVMTIAQEARSENYQGKLAVAEVIRNRMAQKFFSDGTVRGTVLKPYQFSGWNSSDPNRISCAGLRNNDPIVLDCLKAWNEAVSKETNITGNAVSYFAHYIAQPDWAGSKQFEYTCQIGAHLFYKRKLVK
jgi:N-acetylmuramoyl-L-alanine amidase